MTERRREKTSAPVRQNTVVVDTALGLIVCMLVVQMWLLTASLEEVLAGNRGVAVPGAIVSALLFTACFSLYLLVRRVEKNEQKKSRYDASL